MIKNSEQIKNILLIRHGESTANAGMATSDPKEISLTEKGEEQAKEVAEKIPFYPDLIIISPFLRARQTAGPTIEQFPQATVEIWPEVREFTYLSPIACAGTTIYQRRAKVEDYWKAANPEYVDGKDAESFCNLMDRLRVALQRLHESQANNIVIFTHGQFMKALLMQQNNPKFREADCVVKMRLFHNERTIANCEISWLEGIEM